MAIFEPTTVKTLLELCGLAIGALGEVVVGTVVTTGWPLSWWAVEAAGNSTVALAATNNTLSLFGISIPCQVQFGHFVFTIGVADASNNSDIGLYDATGNLVAHIGAQHLGTNTLQSQAVVGGPITINPGRYYFATTSVATTATIAYSNNAQACLCFVHSTSFGSSTGGALPSSISPPAENPVSNFTPVFALTT